MEDIATPAYAVVPTVFYSTPASDTVATFIPGTPPTTAVLMGQVTDVNLASYSGHVQFMGAKVIVTYAGKRLDMGGTAYKVAGQNGTSLLAYDNTVGNINGVSCGYIKAYTAGTTMDVFDKTHTFYFPPQGPHTSELLEIPERIVSDRGFGTRVAAYGSANDPSFMENGWTNALVIETAVPAAPIHVEITMHYRTSVSLKTAGANPARVRPAGTLYTANPTLLAKHQNQTAKANQYAMITGKDPYVMDAEARRLAETII
jgi:hypothetical protein